MSETSESTTASDWGKLVLRIAVGGLMLFHGVSKLIHGIDGIKTMITDRGLPEAMAYGVYVGEVVAPILIIIGLLTRPAAVILAFNMIVAIALAIPATCSSSPTAAARGRSSCPCSICSPASRSHCSAQGASPS